MKSRLAFTFVIFLIFCVNARGVEVSVSELTAEPGSIITVEIGVDDATGLASADVVLEYASAILEAKEARTTDLTAKFLLAANIDVLGKVTVAIAGFPGIAEGSGAILEVDFEVKDVDPVTTPLTLSEVTLFSELGQQIDKTIVDGSVTIKGEEVIASGVLTKLEVTAFMYGTHGLLTDGDLVYALESSTLDLDQFVDQNVTIQGTLIHSGLDGGPPLVDVLSVEVEEPPGPPVVREHTPDSLMLALQATYDEADVHGHTYVDIWKGSMPIEAGMFLEFQVAMFSGNPTFKGSVDLHTTDGSTLRDSGAKDQNDVSAHPAADLSEYARDQWYHRTIPLDALAGKTLDGVMIATDSDEHYAGVFRVYVDNIQITDGEYILTAIYMGEDTIPGTGTTTATDTTFAGTEGMSDYSVAIVGETSVSPGGKLIGSWGSVKSGR